MQKVFEYLIKISGIQGVLLISSEGEVRFEYLSPLIDRPLVWNQWEKLFVALEDARDAELIFEKSRVYVHRVHSGYVVVIMELIAPVAMVRLQCDILMPVLKELKSEKKIF